MAALELKVPPVALVLICGALMCLGSLSTPALHFAFPGQRAFAAFVALAGLLSSAIGVVEFRRAKTTVNPTKPGSASSLVASGIYRFTRNPMYVGFLLLLIAWALWLGHLLAFTVLPLFIVYMNIFQIRPEERALTAIFGDDFKTYCSRVRRWI